MVKKGKENYSRNFGCYKEIEPLKTQFVISSDTAGEDRAVDEEDSVSNEETSSGDSSSDEDTTEEDSNY